MEQKEKTNNTALSRSQKEKLAAAKQERANKIVSIVIAVMSVLIIAALLIFIPLSRKRAGLKEYFRVNDEPISALEFNYYQNRVMNNFLTTYGSILQYIGLDTTQDLSTQIYDTSTGLTWEEYFAEQAVTSIAETRALIADMKAKGETVDISETLKLYKENLATTAESANSSVKDYLVRLYGESATEARIMSFIEDELTSSAYYSKLMEKYAASDEDVQKEIDDNEIKYTSVDYRILPFYTELPNDASDSEVEEALKKAEVRANEMLAKVLAGEDFEELCVDYATEIERTNYADPDTDKSLDTITDLTPSDAYVGFSTWLFDEERKSGEAIVYTDDEQKVVYVLKFEKRYLADSTKTSVKNTLTSATVNKYLDELTASYKIINTKNTLTFMDKKTSEDTAE